MHINFLVLTTFSLFCLSACASKPKEPEVPIENLSCSEILTKISETEVALAKAENSADYYDGGIDNVYTGGSIGVQGGSRSGVGVGVGISMGVPFGGSRNSKYKRAQLDVSTLQTKLIALQKQALEKKC